jgi:hypothetical protein
MFQSGTLNVKRLERHFQSNKTKRPKQDSQNGQCHICLREENFSFNHNHIIYSRSVNFSNKYI